MSTGGLTSTFDIVFALKDDDEQDTGVETKENVDEDDVEDAVIIAE